MGALANGLSISVCMWGNGGWANNPTMGQKQIGEKWGQLATLWKHYPNKLVFELMNEPAGVGFPKTDAGAVNAMGIYNAAAQAIRDADPARPILIGTAGFNDAEWLDFVTEKYLTYTFSGKGFMSDPNMGVTMHFYQPNHGPHLWFAMNEGVLGDNDTAWQAPILNQIMYAVNWRKKIGANIPVVTTEWGCWMFKSRTDGTCKGCHAGDLEKWADYTLSLFKTHDIGNMWYVGIMDNQASYAMFDTEYGWNPVVEKLTGAKVTSWPGINQAINGEFLSVDHAWAVSTPQITKTQQAKWDKPAPYSGDQMLKLTVPGNLVKGGQLYLQTFHEKKKQPTQAAPRTLLHLIQGITYKISFIAGTNDGEKGSFTVKLRNAKTQAVIKEYTEIQVSGSAPQASSLQYKHDAATVDDVRLEFEVGAKAQVLYLDNVEFVRDSTASTLALV